ncbi:MAG: hypothetical protein JXR82_17125 [Marinifilaceae bacterium]|nr:hypothetical protein [Marinifilaceae bacterium]
MGQICSGRKRESQKKQVGLTDRNCDPYTKYYGHQKISYLYLLISQIAWSFAYTLFYTSIKIVI